jgi:hypothetical protein
MLRYQGQRIGGRKRMKDGSHLRVGKNPQKHEILWKIQNTRRKRRILTRTALDTIGYAREGQVIQ